MRTILPDGFKSESGLIYDHAEVGEITGRQQNYLMDIKGLQSGLGHVTKMLEDLVIGFYTADGNQFHGSIKSALSRISVADVETLLIKIRENTFGPIYFIKNNCTHCNHLNEMKLTLSALEITSTPASEKEVTPSLTLPKSGKTAELKLMGIEELNKSFKIFQKSQAELLTTTAALALKSLDGKQDLTSEDLKPLPVLDIKFINDEYKKMGGKIDTTITHECKECGKDFDTILNVVDPSFFSLT